MQNKRAFIEKQIARYQAQLDEIDSRPAEPEGAGNVVKFEKRFGGNSTYTYAAVQVALGSWYVTGAGGQVRSPMSWSELIDLVEEGETDKTRAWCVSNMLVARRWRMLQPGTPA